jgi:AcrR family transcriptional regulator
MEILSAARQLFAERGYGPTSMAAIAESAGSAVQTIYDTVGSKAAVLTALIERIEQPVEGTGTQSETAVRARDVLAHAVRLTRIINEQSGDILAVASSVSTTERFAADALKDYKRRHIDGTRNWMEMMTNQGLLNPDVTLDDAAITLGALTTSAVWRELTVDFGLTFKQAEEWMIGSLSHLLLSDEQTS